MPREQSSRSLPCGELADLSCEFAFPLVTLHEKQFTEINRASSDSVSLSDDALSNALNIAIGSHCSSLQESDLSVAEEFIDGLQNHRQLSSATHYLQTT